MKLKKILTTLFIFVSFISIGQTQLVLLNKEKVLVRYVYGDDITYKLKGSNHYTTDFITDIKEFEFIVYKDTVPFASIERISLKGHPQTRFKVLSKFLITAGVAYFTLDQVNNVIVHGQKPDMEPSVWKPSLAMVATGLALKLIHKHSQKIRFPAKLMAVERGSKFYLSDQ